ncbi:MAG: 4-alpha-glucanotransferase [Bacteroidia bacterium]|nr:4-alpha-glucanotransferase [Bacteroidia bacterium]
MAHLHAVSSNRQAGLLMPVSALPNRHGIGDFGQETVSFLKLVKKAGFSYWQILPLNPIGYGHSPYQPFSSLAMDETYISLDELAKDGLLGSVPSFRINAKRVDFEKVKAFKTRYLHKAFANAIKRNPAYLSKLRKKMAKYHDYAVFMAFKKAHDYRPWNEWNEQEKNWAQNHSDILSKYQTEIDYQLFVQAVLIKQWNKIKDKAHRLGLSIIGDLPFYVGHDSVDCYMNQKYFFLDQQGLPKLISGVGPDYFSKTGQRWGNPIYNFDMLKRDGYRFLIERIKDCGDICDFIRLDHFRAFDTYYVINAFEATAERGEWKLGPSYDFFEYLFKDFDSSRIIAEDLGAIRPEVLVLRDHYRFPGMDVMQFEILSDEVKPVNAHNVYYIGTHDNDTLKGWYLKLDGAQKGKLRAILRKEALEGDIFEQMMKYALHHPNELCVLFLADILKLDNRARINKPGIIDDINWTYRLQSLDSFADVTLKVRSMIEESQR